MNTKESRLIHLIGYASGLGGVSTDCGDGPLRLQQAFNLKQYESLGIRFNWDAIFKPALRGKLSKAMIIKELCASLALCTAELTRQKQFFIVTGGDHSSAIGTWSGVSLALSQQGPLGLIWVDAHMDSHLPETSHSGRLHGMPLAALLGHGNALFTQLLFPAPKIKPEHLCLIGVRCFEKEEAAFLKKLKVRVYFMDEVKKRGYSAVFKEAVQLVNQGTAGYGISVDVDSLDPQQAPAVDVPEANGLKLNDLSQVLCQLARDARLLGAEISEFNPHKDIHGVTEKAIFQLMAALTGIC